MAALAQAAFLTMLTTARMSTLLQEQKLDYTQQAELDAQGNIYVSSDKGNLVKMADGRDCSEAMEAGDRQTFGCRIMPDGQS